MTDCFQYSEIIVKADFVPMSSDFVRVKNTSDWRWFYYYVKSYVNRIKYAGYPFKNDRAQFQNYLHHLFAIDVRIYTKYSAMINLPKKVLST